LHSLPTTKLVYQKIKTEYNENRPIRTFGNKKIGVGSGELAEPKNKTTEQVRNRLPSDNLLQ